MLFVFFLFGCNCLTIDNSQNSCVGGLYVADDDKMDYAFYVGLPLLLKMARFDLVLLFEMLLKQFNKMIDEHIEKKDDNYDDDNDEDNNNDNNNNNFGSIDDYYNCQYEFFGIKDITPLYVAIRYNCTRIVEYLLNVAIHNPACCNYSIEKFNSCDNARIKPNSNNYNDHRRGISICKMMRTQTWINNTDFTPMELSILCCNNDNKYINCLDKLFDHMLKCNYNNIDNNNNNNNSNYNYNQESISRLVNGETQHTVDDCGRLIHLAIERRLDQMIELLLKYGADVNAQSTSGTPLCSTIRDAFYFLDHYDDPFINPDHDDDVEEMKTKYLNIFKTIVWNKNVLLRFEPGHEKGFVYYRSHLMSIVDETKTDLYFSIKNKNEQSFDCKFVKYCQIIKTLACDMFEILIERIIYDEKNGMYAPFFTIDTIFKDRDYFDKTCSLFMYAARYGQCRILKILLNILNQAKENGYFNTNNRNNRNGYDKKEMINDFLNGKNSYRWNICNYLDNKGETGYIAACRQIKLLTSQLSSSPSPSISNIKNQVIESYIQDYQTSIGLLVNDFGVDVTIKDENGKFGSDFIPNDTIAMKDLKSHLKHHESTYNDTTVFHWFNVNSSI